MSKKQPQDSLADDSSDNRRPRKHVAKLAYFAGDATNPTVRLRIGSFMRQSVDVIGFTFRRDKFHIDFVPFWKNVELGRTKDRNYRQRLFVILAALGPIWRNRTQLREVDVLYARLFDAAFLAMLARYLLRLDAKLVIEITLLSLSRH